MIIDKNIKGKIIYIEGHSESVKQSCQALDSFESNGFINVKREPGITPETLDHKKFTYKITENSRLKSFINNKKKFLTKLSCVHNHLKLCQEIIYNQSAQLFAEHDCICIDSFESIEVEDFCFLNYDTAFTRDSFKKNKFKKYKGSSKSGVQKFPIDYPLKCNYNSIYKGAILPPGTAGYILTPSGAEKIIEAVKLHGLEQSDFLINSYNLKLEYISPSICTYNPINLKTSHGF